MPKMRNISQRTFVIGGKTLKKGETGDFAQSVIDRHVSMYPQELEAVAGDIDVGTKKEEVVKESLTTENVEEAPVVAENETTETVANNATVEEVAEDAPTPKRRGRKPKAKE